MDIQSSTELVVALGGQGHLSETEQTLSAVSDISVYIALGLLTAAMAAFSVHLAVQGSAQQRGIGRAARERAARRVPVAAGAINEDRPSVADPSGSGTEPAANNRRWGMIGMQAVWLAAVALAVCVATRTLAVGRAPLGNMYEFALVTGLTALIVYGVWALRRELLWLGLFVSGTVLLIVGAAVVSWYVPAGPLMPALNNSIWLIIHVITASISIGIFVVGGVLSALFLGRDRAEEQAAAAGGQVTGWTRAFPSARTIERIAYGTHIIAFPLFTFTLIAGSIWAEEAWGRYWNWDPKEIWTFVIWVVYAIYLHARATAGVPLRRSAWFALAGLGAIVINYTIVNTVINSMHSYSGL